MDLFSFHFLESAIIAKARKALRIALNYHFQRVVGRICTNLKFVFTLAEKKKCYLLIFDCTYNTTDTCLLFVLTSKLKQLNHRFRLFLETCDICS